MTSKTPSELPATPRRVTPAGRRQAILRLLPAGASPSDAADFEAYARDSKISLDWLYTLPTRDDLPGACLLIVPSPGRTAMLFVSPIDHRDHIPRQSHLIQFGLNRLQETQVVLAQALLQPADAHSWAAYEAVGFSQLATLQYMEAGLVRRRPVTTWPGGLSVCGYDDTQQADLACVLEASYIDTLDCPGLRGLRHVDDVIRGHQSIGRYDAGLWTLLRHNKKPVGAILINRSTRPRQGELVYIGLAPEARGNGWGAALLAHGMSCASRAKLHTLSLAVDLENTPAMALYAAEGFVGVNRRLAVIRSTSPMQTGSPIDGCPPAVDPPVDNTCG